MMLSVQLYALVIVVLVALGVIAYAIGRTFGGSTRQTAPGSRQERDQSERWARPQDVPQLVVKDPLTDRAVLGMMQGKWIAAGRLQSVRVIAPTGSGKTASYVVPMVLRWRGPAVVTSVKADALVLTQDRRRDQGPVWVFDPVGTSGQETCRWSPIAYADTYGGALRAAMWLVSSSKVEKRPSADQALWDTLGKDLVAPALFAANRTGQEMAEVARWLMFGQEDDVLETLRGLDDVDALAAWTSVMKYSERTKSSIYATARLILAQFTHPDVRTALTPGFGGETFDAGRLLDEGGTLYVVAPASDQEDFTAIFETLVNSVVREVESRSTRTALPIDPPLLLMLDEAANCAPLRKLPSIASAGRGQGIQLVSIWQDESQIETIYGATIKDSITSNHVCKVVLPGVSDEGTLERVSKLVGPHTVERESRSVGSDGRVSTSRQPISEPLATPDYIRTLPEDEVIVVVGNKTAMRLNVMPWYRDPDLRALVDPAVANRFDAAFGGVVK